MIKVLLFDFSWVLVFPKSGQGSVSQTYADYAPEKDHHHFLDTNLELVAWVKQQDIPAYILSASSPQMLNALRPEFVPPFKDLFSTKELGIHKHDPQTFLTLTKKLKIEPKEALFTDDTIGNIEAAQAAGVATIHFVSNQDFFKKFTALTTSQ